MKTRAATQRYLARRDAEVKEIIEQLKDFPCTDCGVKYPSWVMQFDHIRGPKLFCVSNAWRSHKSIKAILDETAKCEVVCANCHANRTYQRSRKK